MLAGSGDGTSKDELWSVIALARALQRRSKHRLVLLTNRSKLPDGTSLRKQLRKLDVDVLPLRKVEVPGAARVAGRGGRGGAGEAARAEPPSDVQGLQAWNLTAYEKLVWLDPAVVIYRNVDWLFDREGTWAARFDPECQMTSVRVNPAVLLLVPSAADYRGLLRHAAAHEGLSLGDLVPAFLADVRREPVNLLSEVDADHGQCLGARIPTPYRNSDGTPVTGSWSTPAFVHKSGGVRYGSDPKRHEDPNLCFSVDLQRQRLTAKGRVVNACQYHPLGAYWRDHLCSAVRTLSLRTREVEAFCSDRCYYQDDGCDSL